ncbi:MAG: hypothetical protein KDE53_13400 [Caldilineaceae bacterium]|nr:hypothetical protein [Caldilineaceae bacterium]
MAEWGIWGDELDDLTLSELLQSYARRKRWEYRLLAAEVSQIFAKPTVSAQPSAQQVSGDALWEMMGVEWPSA